MLKFCCRTSLSLPFNSTAGYLSHQVRTTPFTTAARSRSPPGGDTALGPVSNVEEPRTSTPDRQLKDIITTDLTATLDAHRKSNQETHFRKVSRDDGWGHAGSEQESAGADEESGQGITDLEQLDSSDTIQDKNKVHFVALHSSENRGPNRGKGKGSKNAGPSARQRRGAIPPFVYGKGRDVDFWPTLTQIPNNANDRTILSNGIRDVSRFLQLSQLERTFRRLLGESIIRSLSSELDDIEFEFMGSQVTDLAAWSSDIDIAFSVPSTEEKRQDRGPSQGLGRPANRTLIRNKLKAAKDCLAPRGFSAFEIVDARHPLLRASHRGSGVDVQIVLTSKSNSQSEAVRAFVEEYDTLKDVYCFLRYTLEVRGLKTVKQGGLGSYSLFMAIVAAYKHTGVRRKDTHLDALTSVLAFLTDLDTHKVCLAVDPPITFAKRLNDETLSLKAKGEIMSDPELFAREKIRSVHKSQPWLLCLQDPGDPSNDLGRQAVRWPDIQDSLRFLRTRINRDMKYRNKGDFQKNVLSEFIGHTTGACNFQRQKFEKWLLNTEGKDVKFGLPDGVKSNSSSPLQPTPGD